jgi:hypothetical protein
MDSKLAASEKVPAKSESSKMNIKLTPAMGIEKQRGQLRASSNSAGAEAQPLFGSLRHD